MGAERRRAVLTGVLARRAVRSGVRCALVFGAMTVSSIVQFTSVYSTPESRRDIAVSAGGNAAIRVLFGTGRSLETIPGWVAWRSLGIVAIIGSVWGCWPAPAGCGARRTPAAGTCSSPGRRRAGGRPGPLSWR